MARRARLSFVGELHLLQQQCPPGTSMFKGDVDRAHFLDVLARAGVAHEVQIHAFVLLDDGFQVLVTPIKSRTSLGHFVQALGRQYVQAYRRRHGLEGKLWRERFQCAVLQAVHYLVPATIYIESQPLWRGLCAHPEDYPWSSYRTHVGAPTPQPFPLAHHSLFWALGNTPFERQAAYRQAAGAGIGLLAQEMDRALKSNRALGDASYLAGLQAQTDVPLSARARGRPKKS